MDVRMIAHDMRTPLSALMMSMQIIRREIDPDLAPHLDVAIRNAHALANIVEALVDTSTTGHGKLYLGDCLPIDLVASAIDQVAPMAASKKQSLTADEMVALPPLVADATRIVRILVNLLSNAVRFCPEGGHIRIAAKGEKHNGEECVVFSVRDDGPGVNTQDIEKIFLAGVSLGKGGKYSTGLGLSVCKELVEAHKGRIWVEPNQPKGAVFSFSIPTSLQPYPA